MSGKNDKRITRLCDEILENTLEVLKSRILRVRDAEERVDTVIAVLSENAKDIAVYNDISPRDVAELIAGLKNLGSVKFSELTGLATAVNDKLKPVADSVSEPKLEDFIV